MQTCCCSQNENSMWHDDANVVLSYCGFFRTAQLGRISTRHHVEEMEFPALKEDLSRCWCDLIFFFFFWLDDYNRYVQHAIYLSPSASWGVDINAISSWTEDFYGYLIHICGRHFSCTQPFLPRRSSWGNVRAWLADECKDSGGKVGCFASSSVQRIGLVAIQYFIY